MMKFEAKNKLIGRMCRLRNPTMFGWQGAGVIVFAGHGDDPIIHVQKDGGGIVTCVRSEVALIRRRPETVYEHPQPAPKTR